MARPRADHQKTMTMRNLNRLLDQTGWSQADLARRASDYLPGAGKIRPNQISQWLRGEHAPSKPAAVALAKALGVELRDISPHYGESNQDALMPPRLDITTVSQGMVHLIVNTHLPLKIAMEIAMKVEEYWMKIEHKGA